MGDKCGMVQRVVVQEGSTGRRGKGVAGIDLSHRLEWDQVFRDRRYRLSRASGQRDEEIRVMLQRETEECLSAAKGMLYCKISGDIVLELGHSSGGLKGRQWSGRWKCWR